LARQTQKTRSKQRAPGAPLAAKHAISGDVDPDRAGKRDRSSTATTTSANLATNLHIELLFDCCERKQRAPGAPLLRPTISDAALDRTDRAGKRNRRSTTTTTSANLATNLHIELLFDCCERKRRARSTRLATTYRSQTVVRIGGRIGPGSGTGVPQPLRPARILLRIFISSSCFLIVVSKRRARSAPLLCSTISDGEDRTDRRTDRAGKRNRRSATTTTSANLATNLHVRAPVWLSWTKPRTRSA
jgi:hypothetical protein